MIVGSGTSETRNPRSLSSYVGVTQPSVRPAASRDSPERNAPPRRPSGGGGRTHRLGSVEKQHHEDAELKTTRRLRRINAVAPRASRQIVPGSGTTTP